MGGMHGDEIPTSERGIPYASGGIALTRGDGATPRFGDMNESTWQAERRKLRRQAEEALDRGSVRTALETLDRLRSRSVRRRDMDGLNDVLAVARSLAPYARGRLEHELRSLVFAAERNVELLAAKAPPARPGGAASIDARLADAERALRELERELADLRVLAAGVTTPVEPAASEPGEPAPPAFAWEPGPQPAPPSGRAVALPPPPSAEEADLPFAFKRPVQIEPSLADRAAKALREKSAAWILAWAGGIVTALGIVLFFALAVNRGWIGPDARVAAGGLASALVFGSGAYLRRRFGPTYSSLAAVGAGIAGAYATLLAATSLYDLLPAAAGLVAAATIAGVGLVTSLAWRSQLVAGLGLIGAIVSPVGVYDGDVTRLGTAFAAIVLAAAGVVSVRLRWTRLAFVASIVSLPQFLALAGDDPEPDPRLLALGAMFAVAYLAIAVGHQYVSDRAGLRRLPTWLVLASAYVASGITAVYDQPGREGVALLIVGALYGLVAAALMRRERARELGALVAVVALAIAAGAMADLFSGRTLAVAWALEAGLLAWLARRVRDPRFQLSALAYLGLALGHSLAVEQWQLALFQVSSHPATSWPTLLALAAGVAAVGWLTPAFGNEDVPRQGVFGALAPVFDRLRAAQPALRVAGLWSAATLALVTVSLAILELAVRLGPAAALGFDRGQVGVDAVWAAVGLAAVWLGSRRLPAVAAAGWVWLALTVAKVLAYDIDELVRPERSLALLIVGSAVLLAAVAIRTFQALPVGAVLLSIPLVTGGAVELAHGGFAGADANGLALLVVAAAYGVLAAASHRRDRDFSTVHSATCIALVAVAFGVLLSHVWLVLAWSVCAVVLAGLAELLGDKRFLTAAYGFIGLALGYALTVEAPPGDLFLSQPHPADRVRALVIAAAAAAAVAVFCRRTKPARPPQPTGGRYSALAAELEAGQDRWAAVTLWVAGVLTLFACSLVILEIAQTVSSGTVDTDFQRGHVAVSAFWGIVGLALLSIGLVRRSRAFRVAGFVAFGVTVGKIFLYDLANLSAMARALSFLGVGAVLLLGGFFYQRLSEELEERRRPVNAGGSA